MAFNADDFSNLIESKKLELGQKAEEKKADFIQNSFEFQSINGIASNYDGDSSEGVLENYSNPKGFRLGGYADNTSIDAYETAK